MKRRIKLCMLLVSVVMAITGCAQKREVMEEVPLEMEFSYNADYWNTEYFKESVFTSKEVFEDIVKEEIVEICNLLGYSEFWIEENPNATSMLLNVEFMGVKRSVTGRLSGLGKDGVMSGVSLSIENQEMFHDGGLAHELTHILTGSTVSLSLEEGLCEYVRERVGYSKYLDYFSSKGVVLGEQERIKLDYQSYYHRALKYGKGTQEDFEQIWEHIGKVGKGYPYGANTWRSTLWYALSNSFTVYLIEEYGVDAVIDVLQKGEDESAYQQYLGKDLETLKAEWRQYFDELETSMTVEEYIEKVQEIFK